MAIHDEYIEIIIYVNINSNSNRSKVEVKRAMTRGLTAAIPMYTNCSLMCPP